MRIVYDDLGEFAEVVVRCNDTVRKNKCQYCPFYDRCDVADKDSRTIMFADIERSNDNGN